MRNNNAFSLLELSIVLVIIGLIAGGIVAGASMIRAAELRSALTELSQYQVAANTFRDKYLGMPGDLKNATSFWGRADDGTFSGQCASPETDLGTGSLTCNGDGDNEIGLNEHFRFWEHLANAELISGEYTGVKDDTYTYSASDANVATAKISGGLWYAGEIASDGGNSERYDLNYKNYFLLGAFQTNSTPNEPLLTPSEAWGIDKKLDDGLPASGKVIARHWDDECASANDGTSAVNDFDASYRLDDDSVQCAVYFRNAF